MKKDGAKSAVPPPKPDFGLPDRLLPIAAVEQLAGLSRSMIYRLERRDKFPKRFKPGGVASRWSEQEVLAWKAELSAARG